MIICRVVKNKTRTTDLSGIGAYKQGGRWNNKGTYMVYTSENSSLAFLETLVHFDEDLLPPRLYRTEIEIDDSAPIYEIPKSDYPKDWLQLDLLENKALGDGLMKEMKWLAIKVRSAVNTSEYNYLLNPLFPRFHDLAKVIDVQEIPVDTRLRPKPKV